MWSFCLASFTRIIILRFIHGVACIPFYRVPYCGYTTISLSIYYLRDMWAIPSLGLLHITRPYTLLHKSLQDLF